jgi:hypothetical protein
MKVQLCTQTFIFVNLIPKILKTIHQSSLPLSLIVLKINCQNRINHAISKLIINQITSQLQIQKE